MTATQLVSQLESWTTGVPSSPATSTPAQVIVRDFFATRALPLPNTVSLDSLIGEFETDADLAQHLANARRNLAITEYAEEPESFSCLRLSAGLSQTRLAELTSTSQSHIACIESGKNDPSTDMIARIAKALNIDEVNVYRAVRHQITTRGQNK